MLQQECVDFVHGLPSGTVAIQAPDHLLGLATDIASDLKNAVILADSVYSPCCVDFLAASRVPDLSGIIHLGEACLTPHDCPVPVLYLFQHLPIDIDYIRSACDSPFTLLYNLNYQKAVVESEEQLAAFGITLPTYSGDDSIRTGPYMCNPQFKEDPEHVFVYLGGAEDPYIVNFMLNWNSHTVYCLDGGKPPKIVSKNSSRTLNRRYFLIQKTKDAEIVGVIVGTLAMKHFKVAIDSLKVAIEASGKRCVMLLIGKVNDSKLANFLDIDIYVNVSCPFSVLIDTMGFIKDVITPFELQIALGGEWTGEYSTEPLYKCDIIPKPLNEEATYSLVSRKIIDKDEKAQDFRQLIASERIFQGLDPKIGQTPVASIGTGLKGVARSYTPVEDKQH